MSILNYLIDGLATYISNGNAWGMVQGAVHSVKDSSLSGEEKKAAVFQRLEEIAIDFGGYVLNLLIELAVSKIKRS
jgi:hypothetical protein